MEKPIDEVLELSEFDVPADVEVGILRDVVLEVQRGMTTDTIRIALRYSDEARN